MVCSCSASDNSAEQQTLNRLYSSGSGKRSRRVCVFAGTASPVARQLNKFEPRLKSALWVLIRLAHHNFASLDSHF